MRSPAVHLVVCAPFLCAAFACSGRSVPIPDAPADAATESDPSDASGSDGASAAGDGAGFGSDGSAPYDGAGDPGTDGTPVRVACTSTFGGALGTTHGRIDGRLVALVPTTQHGCSGDSTHLHLQIQMNGATYDVAVNLDALVDEIDAPLPRGAWSEGWHPSDTLDYVSDLSLHAPAFTASTPTQIEQRLETALANANHVAIFATGYGPGGAHLVHRNGGGNDGAIFLDPLAPTAHAFVFHFSNQSF